MSLLTEEQKQQLLNNGKPENRDKDHAPVVRLFIPFTMCTWLLSELDYEEPDIAFGLCDLGMGFPELGCLSLQELSSTKLAGILGVMRDNGFSATYPMSVYAQAARWEQMITFNPDLTGCLFLFLKNPEYFAPQNLHFYILVSVNFR